MKSLLSRSQTLSHPLARIALAVGCVVCSVLLQFAFDRIAPGRVRVSLIFVGIAAWYGGTAAGLLCAALYAVANLYWFIPPDDSFAIQSFADGVQFVSSVVLTFFTGFATGTIRRNREEALEYGERRAQFAANVSHEIRTPLNSVLGVITLLRETRLDGEQKELLDTAQNAAQQLLRLINNVLDSSKIDSGNLISDCGDFDLPREVARSLELCAPAAKAKGLSLDLDVDPGFPAQVRGDFGKLRQIVVNLVDNAVKFTERGGVKVRVRADGREGDCVVARVEVVDTGIGIPAGAEKKIFEPFVQVDGSASRRYEGTGLGLSICQRLIAVLCGEIGVKSEPGKGSLFWFTLPLQLSANVVPSAPSPTPGITRRNRPRILLGEDNPMNQLVLRKMLERFGCFVDIAADGEEALRAVRRLPYDLVLMDCQMPRVDGFEAARRIRIELTGRRRLPVVAITAHDSPANRARCTESGMDDYLAKPVEVDMLAAVLRRWLPLETERVESTERASGHPVLVSQSQLLDHRALERLSVGGEAEGRELAAELARAFLNRAPAREAELRRSLETGDARALEQVAHDLKSGCALLGAARLLELCEKLEEVASRSEMETAVNLVDSIGRELGKVTPVLKELAGERAATTAP
jgi:signal transduction histidine kinase